MYSSRLEYMYHPYNLLLYLTALIQLHNRIVALFWDECIVPYFPLLFMYERVDTKSMRIRRLYTTFEAG
jgi:hypothetical protein